MAKLIFLIGMPAAGKTYWGQKLADKYGLQFVDLDVFVSEQEKASISALFASYGENGFRERELKYLNKLIKTIEDDTVIACGGGTPCFGDNMRLMKEAGTVIYLQADVAELLANLQLSDEIRPLLRGRGDMAAYLEGLLAKRKSFYEQADYILPSQDISLATFAKMI
jgi:shikimate kinase